MQNIELALAGAEDARLLHRLQTEAFLPLYETYHDDETSPVKETLARLTQKITEPDSEFYLIRYGGEPVGGIRVRHHEGHVPCNDVNWISPLFVIPSFQNRGIAQAAIQAVFALYPNRTWKLDTIAQEAGNCHLYEKCGFVRVGAEQAVNERMSLIGYEKTCVPASPASCFRDTPA